jgi:hypothetical protein
MSATLDENENPFLVNATAHAMVPTANTLPTDEQATTASSTSTERPFEPAARNMEDMGIYSTDDNSLRRFTCPPSPHVDVPQTRTPVDLVLPPLKAFYTEGWCSA